MREAPKARLLDDARLAASERELLEAGRLPPVQYDVAQGAARFESTLSSGGASVGAGGVGNLLSKPLVLSKLLIVLVPALGTIAGYYALQALSAATPASNVVSVPVAQPRSVTPAHVPQPSAAAVVEALPAPTAALSPRPLRVQPAAIEAVIAQPSAASVSMARKSRARAVEHPAYRQLTAATSSMSSTGANTTAPELTTPPTAAHEAAAPGPREAPRDNAAEANARKAASAVERLPRADQSQADRAQPEATTTISHAEATATTRAADPAEDSVDELRGIARARLLLRSDPHAALILLAELAHAHPHGYFVEERSALAILALVATGDSSQAEQRATAFLKTYPKSPYVDRVRAAVDR